jgi:hypothetical protein
MDKWQTLCGELLTFQTSDVRKKADEARAKEAELNRQLGDSEKHSRELDAQADKAAKRVVNLEEMLRCDRDASSACYGTQRCRIEHIVHSRSLRTVPQHALFQGRTL